MSTNELLKRIKVIGDGGCFADDLKKTSFYLDPEMSSNKNMYLFECNWDTFQYFKSLKEPLAWADTIICITHPHEDHIGGLSTFLFYLKYVLGKDMKTVTIVCPDIADMINYLDLTGFDYAEVNIKEEYSDTNNITIEKTTTRHCEGMNACGFHVTERVMEKGQCLDGQPVSHSYSFYYTGDTCKLDTDMLHEYIATDMAIISEITSAEVSPIHMTFKRFEQELQTASREYYNDIHGIVHDANRIRFVHYDNAKAKKELKQFNL